MGNNINIVDHCSDEKFGSNFRFMALLLAAGESKRYGKPKQLVEFYGCPLLRLSVKKIKNLNPRILKVILGKAAKECVQVIADLEVEAVINKDWAQGVGSSLKLGIDEFLPFFENEMDKQAPLLVSLCDQPLIPSSHYYHLVDSFYKNKGTDIIATSYLSDGSDCGGVPAVFSRRMLDKILASFDEDGEGSVYNNGAKAIIRSESNKLLLSCPQAQFDIDTVSDLQTCERYAALGLDFT
ncbi:MAG: nucleotidyltransferase family protein [Bdellovibrionota bacterium]